MPRRVEDIIRSDKRSIKNVLSEPVKKVSTREKVIQASEAEEEVPIHVIKMTPKEIEEEERNSEKVPQEKIVAKKKVVKKSGKKIWFISAIVVVAVVIVAGYVASIYFSRAKFTIVPVTVPINVANTTIVATATTTAGYLRYEVVPYTATVTKTIPATDGPYISTKASGTVTIFNNYSKEAQRLIAGTRFASNSGRIYRLTSSIAVPGMSSLKATITADEPGAEYNLSKTSEGDLKIVAYKGGPRYDTVYGRLSTDITDGFVGTKKTVSPAQLASTTKEIQSTLTGQLLAQSRTGLREGYITYPNAFTTSFTPAVVGGVAKNEATISVTGIVYSIIFRQTDLVSKLAGIQKLSVFGNSAYETSGLTDLTFTITNPGNFNPAKGTALIARLNGDMRLTGIVPIEELRSKLAGLSLGETKDVLISYGSVIDVPKSSGELFPSWAKNVPTDQSRISIVID